MILCSLISHAPTSPSVIRWSWTSANQRQPHTNHRHLPHRQHCSHHSRESCSRAALSYTMGSTRLTSDLLKAPKKCRLGWPLCIPNDRMPWWRKWNPIKNHSRRDYRLYATNFPEIAPDSDSDPPPASSKQIPGALKYLALFDISIWHIDCRYINTFEKYRYRYQYRYGHFWKYRYRYRYR